MTDKTQDEGYRFIEPFVKLKTAFITVLFLYLILYSINPSLPVLRYCGENVLIVDHVYYSPRYQITNVIHYNFNAIALVSVPAMGVGRIGHPLVMQGDHIEPVVKDR